MPTIGVAIPVPEPYGSLLREKRAAFGDPMAETVPSHVTLIPPTDVDEADLEAVGDALDRASASLPSFSMRLRGTGTFRPVSPVVFVAVSQGISYTEMLAKCVRTALAAPEPEFPFHPHVTVAQQLDDAVLDAASAQLSGYDASFEVCEVDLYELGTDGRWRSVQTFRLGG